MNLTVYEQFLFLLTSLTVKIFKVIAETSNVWQHNSSKYFYNCGVYNLLTFCIFFEFRNKIHSNISRIIKFETNLKVYSQFVF